MFTRGIKWPTKRRVPTIDRDHRPGHIGSLVRGEECDDTCDLLGFRHTADRCTGLDATRVEPSLRDQAINKPCTDIAGRNRIDPNAIASPFAGQHPSHHGDTSFGYRIGSPDRHTHLPGYGPEIYYCAATAFSHMRCDRLRHKKCAVHMDGDGPLKNG